MIGNTVNKQHRDTRRQRDTPSGKKCQSEHTVRYKTITGNQTVKYTGSHTSKQMGQ